MQLSAQRVLFVGNSLTLANGLPAMVSALADAAGDPPIVTRTVASGGVSLEDHWRQGEARLALARGGWSAIVLQQGPSSQPDSQDLLREFVRLFDRDARKVKARVALYMVWPPRSGPGTFAQVSLSYSRAAADVGGLLLPVGDVFRDALAIDPRLALLGPDGFHPTPLGTLLAAIVIHQRLSARAVPFVPAMLESPTAAFAPIRLAAETMQVFRTAASRTAVHQ